MRLLACVLAATALLLAACGGGQALRPGAWLDITVLPGGDAELDVHLGTGIRTDAELRGVGERLARMAFPEAGDVRVTTKESRGYPVARAEIYRAYRPGRTVSARIDTGAMWGELAKRGLKEARVRLWLPSVPATVNSSVRPLATRTWRLEDGRPAPSIAFELRPQPARWFGEAALLVVATGCAAAALMARRRFAVIAAVGAVAAAAGTVVTAGGRQGDNLGVAGTAHGAMLTVTTAAPLLTLVLGLFAAVLLGRWAVVLMRSPKRAEPGLPSSGGPPRARPRD